MGFFLSLGLLFLVDGLFGWLGCLVGWVVWVADPNGIWRMVADCVRSRVNVL